MNYIEQFLANPVVLPTFMAWILANSLKVVTSYITYGRIDFRRFLGAGGMPSSHTAFVSSLAAAVGITSGFHSAAFAVAIGLALVVMSDAAGVRRAAGKQAKTLNDIMDLIVHQEEIPGKKLKELLGHTPFEVFAGLILGVGVSILLTTA